MTTLAAAKRAARGGCPPRYGTPRSPERATLGPRVAEVAAKLGTPLMAHQRNLLDVALEINPETGYLAYPEVVFVGPRQATGKALDKLTPMMTTRGWVPMAEVRVGDHVYHPDGHPVRVTFTSNEMVGHVCYRVTMTDGRTIVVDGDHWWTVLDRETGRRETGTWRTLTTAAIRDLMAGPTPRKQRYRNRFQLPIQRAIKSPDVELPIDPYVFGMWLGDGTSTGAHMTVGDEDRGHVTAEIERAGYLATSPRRDPRTGAWTLGLRLSRVTRTCDRCSDAGPCWSNGLCRSCYRKAARRGTVPAPQGKPESLLGRLRVLGVLGNKHAPEVYLSAGHDQRLALLQGLLDTDGGIDKRQGVIEFSSTRRVLCEAVLYLARSLGWRATMREGVATLNGRAIGPKWRTCWTPTTDEPPPFRLARKAARVRPRYRTSTVGLSAVAIASIEPVPSRPVRCIKVDSPDGLFLAGRDLVATHNTFTTLPLMTHRCMGFTAELAAWVAREYGMRIPAPGPQRVLFLAQDADDSRVKWRRVHLPRLKGNPYTRNQFTATLTQNKEAFTWANGSIWTPGSATALTAGTGDSIDLGILDEYWSHKTNRAELGLRPATMTRPWRQIWKCSMVPGLSRVLPDQWKPLRAAMTAGRARVDADVREGTAYFEFSAEPGLDPADPTTWWTCLPAMGSGTISERTIREDYDHYREAGNLIDFYAEYLGWEPKASTPRWLVIGENVWTDRHDPNSAPGDPIALGVASTANRSWTTIGMAALREDSDVHVEVIDRRAGIDWAAERIIELIDSWDVCAITINPAGQEASLIDDLTARMDRLGHTMPLFKPTLREVCAASARFVDATGQPLEDWEIDDEDSARGVGVWHLGQAELSRAVAAVTKRQVGAALWEFDLSGPTDALRAVAAAWWGGIKVDWPGAGYDIKGSLG